MDENRGHVDVVGRHFEVEFLHRIEVRAVLLGDQENGDVVDVDLVQLDEMQQQIERAMEGRKSDFVRGIVEFDLAHRNSGKSICIALRTMPSVSDARSLARSLPFRSAFHTMDGSRSICSRLARIGSRISIMISASSFLSSTHPICAARHSRSTRAIVAGSENSL